MIYMVDIDGTLCTNTNGEYERAMPFPGMIEKVNALYDSGQQIICWTARGTTTGRDWTALTQQQLKAWGVKHHELRFGKPHYDRWVDDKAVSL